MTDDDRISVLERKVDALAAALSALIDGGIGSVRQRQVTPMSLQGSSEARRLLTDAGLT